MSDEILPGGKPGDTIRASQLPDRRPDRTWGGQGVGAECTICGAPVTRDELEFEIEFNRDDDPAGVDKHHVHVHCYRAWEIERQGLDLARAAAATPSGGALPEMAISRKLNGHGGPTQKRDRG